MRVHVDFLGGQSEGDVVWARDGGECVWLFAEFDFDGGCGDRVGGSWCVGCGRRLVYEGAGKGCEVQDGRYAGGGRGWAETVDMKVGR